VNDRWLFFPAVGRQAGLGHQRRCQALAAQVADPVWGNEVATNASEGQAATTLLPETIARLEPQWIILDNYEFNAADQRAVQATGRQLLVIDDNHHLEAYHADLILNPNVGAESLIYRGSPLGRRLLGSDFAMVAPDVRQQSPLRHNVPKVAKRVLVTTGGGNPNGARDAILAALALVEVDPLDVAVVVSAVEGEVDIPLPQNGRHRFTIQRAPSDLARLMAESDLAISTAGVTLQELAYLGVPTLALVAADNQEPGAKAFAKAGAVELAGRVETLQASVFARQIAKLVADSSKRRTLSERGQPLIDGRGAERVARAMRDMTIHLRPATIDDRQQLFEWANDPEVRKASFQSATIDAATHDQWLQSQLHDANCTICMASDGQRAPLGQVRFERSGVTATISVSVDAKQRGKRRGTRLIHLACRRYFYEHDVQTIVAFIKPRNEASLKVFERVGFVFAQETTIHEQPATEWRLARDAWK